MFFARIFGNFVDKAILKKEGSHGIGYFVATIFADLVLGILASIIVMWFSRRREYRADEAGAHLAGTSAMIGALQRLRSEPGVANRVCRSTCPTASRHSASTAPCATAWRAC